MRLSRKGSFSLAELLVILFLVLVVGGIGYQLFLAPRGQNKSALKQPVASEEKPVNVAPEPVEKKPVGPLSFWSGEIIIGEGPHRGKIELLSHKGLTSVLLEADTEGKCWFDAIEGIEPCELYIRLQNRGQAPLVSMASFQNGTERRMWPVQEWSDHVKQGKITPLLMPHIDSPFQRVVRQQGQYFSGLTWSIAATPGADPTKGSPLHWDLPAPLAIKKVDFEPVIIDLVKQYATTEELADMAKEDIKFSKAAAKNQSWDFTTSVGKFQIVTCCDRYSIDARAGNNGGWCFSTLVLPSGKVLKGSLGTGGIAETQGSVFMVGRQSIFKWIGNDQLRLEVGFLDAWAGGEKPYIAHGKEGFLLDHYLAVNKSSRSNFGGLLEYQNGMWKFHPYDGDYHTWMESVEREGENIILTLWGKEKIRFNPKDGKFTDL